MRDQGKPTCSTCPHFSRQTGATTLDAPGECHYDPCRPVPMPQGQQMAIMPLYPPTRHDLSCHHHPMMSEWIDGIYCPAQRKATEDGVELPHVSAGRPAPGPKPAGSKLIV